MFPGQDYLYYISFALQGFCAYHSFKNGTQQKWLWIIIFLPYLGSLIYIYQEILSRREISAAKIDVKSIINPGSKLKKLEDEVRFTDTFANRIKLADAYLAAGQTDKAVEIYKASQTGAFAENEHVMAQLMIGYYELGRYAEVLPLAQKLYNQPRFIRSKAHVVYAKSLELSGNIRQADDEFKLMKGRYSYFEQRYQYGLFLMRQDKVEEAEKIFTDMLEEQPHLSAVENRSNKQWFVNAKNELKKLYV